MSELTLAFTPLLPWPAFALLIVAALGVLGFALYAKQKGAGWRALALALLLAALADPSLVREQREAQKSIVAVVLDRSESQTLGARMTQVDAARKALEDAFAKTPDIEPRFVSVGTGADGTLLFSALAEALKDVAPDRIGAAILVTDGLVHDIPAKAEALGFKAPLHALITGHEGERDRRIELVEAPRFGVVGKDQILRVRVVDSGGGFDPGVTISARRDGEAVATLRASPGEIVEIPVRIEHGGPNVVELETPVVPGELTDIDNKAVVVIEGVRDRLKVLLVSGEPHPGERGWRNLLRADANVELVHFTILRPPEKQDGVPASELSLIAFPTADLFGRKINDFDLIIFDRYSNQTLLPSVYFDNIVELCRKRRGFSGGGRAGLRDAARALLLAAGKHIAGASRWRAVRAGVSRACQQGRREAPGHPRPGGLEDDAAKLGRMVPAGEHQCAEGRQRAARRRGQAVGRALARGQGAGRHVADRSAVAVGARL